MIFTMREQFLNLVAYNQGHNRKKAYIHYSSSGIALSWFLRLRETYKNDCSAFVSPFKKPINAQKNAYYAHVEVQA